MVQIRRSVHFTTLMDSLCFCSQETKSSLVNQKLKSFLTTEEGSVLFCYVEKSCIHISHVLILQECKLWALYKTSYSFLIWTTQFQFSVLSWIWLDKYWIKLTYFYKIGFQIFGLFKRESSEFLSANEIRESFDLPYSDHEPLLVQLLKKRGNTSAERKDQPSSVKSLHSEVGAIRFTFF